MWGQYLSIDKGLLTTGENCSSPRREEHKAQGLPSATFLSAHPGMWVPEQGLRQIQFVHSDLTASPWIFSHRELTNGILLFLKPQPLFPPHSFYQTSFLLFHFQCPLCCFCWWTLFWPLSPLTSVHIIHLTMFSSHHLTYF